MIYWEPKPTVLWVQSQRGWQSMTSGMSTVLPKHTPQRHGAKAGPQNRHQQPYPEPHTESPPVLMGPSSFGTGESVTRESEVGSDSISRRDDPWEVRLCGSLHGRDLTSWSGWEDLFVNTHEILPKKTSGNSVKGFWRENRVYRREIMFVCTVYEIPGLQSCYSQAVSPWASCLPSLCLSVLNYKAKIPSNPLFCPLPIGEHTCSLHIRCGHASWPIEWKRKWWATGLSRSFQNYYQVQPPLFPLPWDQNRGWPWPWHQSEGELLSYSWPTATLKYK